MKREVTVCMTTIHRLEGEEDRTVTAAEGYYHHSERLRMLWFQAQADEADKKMDHKLVFEPTGLRMERFSPGYRSRMCFAPGKNHSTVYSTPFGEIPLEIDTFALQDEVTETGISIRLEYRLSTGGRELGSYEVWIEGRFR